MLAQTESERMKTQERLRNFIRRCNAANQVIWNSRFGNQGANNFANLWLSDAMIQQFT